MSDLRAPFPWFGGKRTIALDVWARLGNVTNYVEPFFGSGAMLLSRDEPGHTETVNDKDRFVANFWRACKADPEAVAHWMDWPVNEADLTARHLWLLGEGARRIAVCDGDPEYFDAQTAGWWCWGACSWIAAGWCQFNGPWAWGDDGWQKRQRPHMGRGRGINRKLPHLGEGRGINRKLPHLGAGRNDALFAWMFALAERLRRVRVCCGDWQRVCGPTVTVQHGLTGVFLDPPYADTAGRTADLYATDDLQVAHIAREWAIAQGRDPMMRIAFAGYEGEHQFPSDWAKWEWKASGGYANQGQSTDQVNAKRERIWFSPHCLTADQRGLFDMVQT